MAEKLRELPSADLVEVPDAVLRRSLALYERGLYVQAHAEACLYADPMRWTGTRALVVASRLANNLGAPRASNAMALHAFRHDRGDPEAVFYAAASVLNTKGTLAALNFLDRHQPRILAASERMADLVAFRARLMALFRDFDRAGKLMAEAEALAPTSAWIAVEKSFILRCEDRYEEALEAARAALLLNPRGRPQVQALAFVLTILGKTEESRDLLENAAQQLESGALRLQLSELHLEHERYADAMAGYVAYESLAPMMEPGVAHWLAGAKARAAYLIGGTESLRLAAAFARKAGGYFFEKMATNIDQAPAAAGRVDLPVIFQRQRHMTCAPTCLAMLSSYFERPVDQETIAAEICYDGTEDHKERRWAEANGYAVREFSIDWPTTVALIDRGLPFCLNTQETSSAHLQIVMGYDSVLKMLLIRDPYLKSVGEFLAEETFERYAHNGPRGMVMVPPDKVGLLAGIAFADEALYEARFRLRQALAEHRRDAATAAVMEARALGEGHWLTLSMELELSRYDADAATVLRLTERLYALNPLNKRYLHHRLSTLREHAKQSVRLELLSELVKKRDCDPVFLVQLADELRHDRRRVDHAEILLKKAVQMRPNDGSTFWYLAEIRRQERRFDAAAEMARIAATLDDKSEFLAQAYFQAARNTEAGPEAALALLAARFAKFGAKSSGPARTLHWALAALERLEEAFAVLDQALRLREADGDLMLYAADAYVRHGATQKAAALLEAALGKVPAVEWHEAQATLAQLRGDRQAALDGWLEVARLSPQNIGAHDRVAQLLDKTKSRKQAIFYLQAVAARQPENRFLRKTLVEWLRTQDSPELEAALKALIEGWPTDAWAHREMALYLAGCSRFDEAEKALAQAGELDPDSNGWHYARGYVARLRGRLGDAQTAFLRALELNVDSDFALAQALRAAVEPEAKAEILARAKGFLLTQTSFGDGISRYFEQAADFLPPTALADAMAEIAAAHDHLPEAWIALARSLTKAERLPAAAEAANEATRRFPLSVAAWLTSAEIQQAAGDASGAERALMKAVEAHPAGGTAVRKLAQMYEERGDLPNELATLAAAVARQPFDAGNLGYLADCLWRSGEKSEAIQRLTQSLSLNFHWDWAWDALQRFGEELGEPRLAGDFALDLAAKRADDAYVWLWCARVLRADHERRALCLEALDRALALEGELHEAYELKVDLLAERGDPEGVAAAVAVLQNARVPHDRMLKLKLKEGRLLLAHGQLTAAIAATQHVLSHEPLNREAWTLRADVACAREDWAAYLAAGEALTRFHPRQPTSHGYLGEARVRNGDLAGARESLAAALAIAPDYEFAALTLCDLELQDGRLAEAEAALSFLRQLGHRTPAILQREAHFLARARKGEEFGALVPELVTLPPEDGARIDRIVEILIEAELAGAAATMFATELGNAEHRETAARFFMPLALRAGLWHEAERGLENLAAADGGGEAWELATQFFLRQLVERKDGALEAWRVETFDRVLARFHARLSASDATWALIGWGLGELKRDAAVTSWLADWETRARVEPWLLYNFSLALRRMGRREEAARVNLAGALHPETDHASVSHLLWTALEKGTRGATDEARVMLAQVETKPADMDEHDRLVFEMATAALAYGSGGARGYWRATRALRKLRGWKRGFAKLSFYDQEFRAAVRRLGVRSGRLCDYDSRLEGYRLGLGVLWVVALVQLVSFLSG